MITRYDEQPLLTVEQSANHIYFYSTVDSDRCLALMKTMRKVDDDLRASRVTMDIDDFPMTPIWLHINSYGGVMFDALAIADQISKIKTPVYSIVEGICASAATMISMACSKRYMTPNSFMLIHQFSSFTFGTYEQFKDNRKLQDSLMDTMTNFYVKHSKLKKAEVSEMLKRDSWMNASECLKKGLVDELWK